VEILATHLGADLDAFASILAAQKLHPQARLFFPGSRAESVRRLVDSGLFAGFAELEAREVDPAAITRLILVDVRQRGRIGTVATWLDANPGIEVVAYDHHPDAEGDVPIAFGVVDPAAGSTATLMAELFRQRGLPLSDLEASLLLCGLYEDTGSLTYATAGARDLEAAAWLLGQGGDLAVVRRFALHSLDRERLGHLHQILESLEIHPLAGHRVGVAALDLPDRVEDLAPLVSRALEISGLRLLFGLFGEAARGRVSVIARGDLPGFDAGEALASWGGGGHATAASAQIKGESLLSVRERLLADLPAFLPPAARARDLMISPVVTLPEELSVAAGKARLLAAAINAAPVTAAGDGGRVVGAVTRQILDAALQHGWGDRPLSAVKSPEVAWIDADAPADSIGERMLGLHPRFVLVGDPIAGPPLGLVSRMALLRHLSGPASLSGPGAAAGERLDRRHAQERETHEPVAHRLRRLPEPLREQIAAIARVSARLGAPAYAVGGFVRDLLLERPNRDLDLLVEGDGPAFAAALADELGGRLRVHGAFLTAEIALPDGTFLDVATARSEFYRSPAALPEVRTSALRQDLFRRDFTVNTLALRLGPEAKPELVDFFGARKDLARRQLKVLHSLSFVDDPTRALRGVRLEVRLGFRMAAETEALLGVALREGVFDQLSGSRLGEELDRLLGDPDVALPGLDRLAELGLLQAIHPGLAASPELREQLREAQAAFDWYRLDGLAEPAVSLARLLLRVLALSLPPAERARLAERLHLPPEARDLLASGGSEAAAARAVLESPASRPHEIDEALAGLPGEEVLLLFAAGGEAVRSRIRDDLRNRPRPEPALRGADLLAHGVPRGPRIGEALRAVRRALLDGEVGVGKDEQLALALRRLAEPAVAGPERGEKR
jgi:tRNA nucleotidyltransferase (CCA-adding enzyme)